MQPAIVGNILNEFRRKLWYLHEDNSTYRFDTHANLNGVIVQKEESVTAQAARKAVEDRIVELINEQSGKAKNAAPLFGSSGGSTNIRPYIFAKTARMENRKLLRR
jgi:hypothetical protein